MFNIKKNGERLNEISVKEVGEKAEKRINHININMKIENINDGININQNNNQINESLELEGI